MINIKTHNKPGDNNLYNYSYYYNDRLINDQGYIRENGLYWNDDPAEIKLVEIYELNIDTFPEKMGLFICKPLPFTELFVIDNFQRIDEVIKIVFTSYEDGSINGIRNAISTYSKLLDSLEFTPDFYPEFNNLDSDIGQSVPTISISYIDNINKHKKFGSFFKDAQLKLEHWLDKTLNLFKINNFS